MFSLESATSSAENLSTTEIPELTSHPSAALAVAVSLAADVAPELAWKQGLIVGLCIFDTMPFHAIKVVLSQLRSEQTARASCRPLALRYLTPERFRTHSGVILFRIGAGKAWIINVLVTHTSHGNTKL